MVIKNDLKGGWTITNIGNKCLDAVHDGPSTLQASMVGSVVVTAYDFESGRPGLNPEWGPIYYKASITAQGLPEPSSLRGDILSTRAADNKGCNWGMQVD